MAAKNEAKIKFSAETQELTAQIRNVNSSMAALRAGLSLNEAEFKNTGNAAEYLRNKQKLLQSQLEQSRAKQEALNGKLEAAKQIYGENSSEAQQWTTKLEKAKTEEEKLKTALNECEDAIAKQTAEEEKAQTPVEKLRAKIANQREELNRLQTEYANVALAEGKDSEAAQSLKGKIDSLNSELKQNEEQLKDVTDATEDYSNAADDGGAKCTFLGNMFANLASEGITFVIQKLKEAAAAVVKLGMDFTSSLSNVQALSGATTSEMAKLEARAKDLGRSTIYSATDVSDAFGYMALAGWDVQDMLSGIDGVLNLAASSNMDLAKASDIVTDYLTAFGLSAQDSGKFVDQMAYAMSNSNTDVEQLGEAYKNVAATAGSMGYSVAETTAALMTMANAGVKGGEAGTGLNAIMTRLATDTKGCASALSDYGVEVYDAQGNMNSLSSILNGCATVWGDLTDEEQANLAKTIAGQSHYSQFQTIMNGLSEAAAESGQSFNDYTQALENCDGAAAEITSTMQDNLSGDMKALGSAAQGLGLAIYDLFDDKLRAGAQLATDAINKITDAITPQKSELEMFIDEIGESNEQVRQSIENARDSMGASMSGLGDMEAYKKILLDVNGVEEKSEWQKYQIKNAVEALSQSIPELADAFDEETGSLNLTNEQLKDLFRNAEAVALQNALLKANTETYEAYADALVNQTKAQSAVDTATRAANKAMEENHKTAGYLAGGYGDLYAEELEAAVALEDAQKVLKDANVTLEDAKRGVDEYTDAFPDMLEALGWTEEEIQEYTSAAKEAADATGEAGDAAEETAETIEAVSEEEAEAAKKAAEEIQKAYEDMASGLQDSMQKAVSLSEGFNGGVEVSATEMLDNLQKQKAGIQQWAEDMARLGKLAGNGMSQSLYDYLVEMGPQSANQVRTLVETLEENTPLFEQISQEWAEAIDLSADPSMLAGFTTVGKSAAGLYQEGLESGQAEINASVNKITSDAAKNADMSPMSNASKQAAGDVSGNMSKASLDTDKYMRAMRAQVQSDAMLMGTYMRSGLNSIPGSVADIMSRAAGKVTSNLNSMKNTLNTTLSGPSFNTDVLPLINSKNSVLNLVNEMRNALNVTLRGPNIQVPHFSMSGSFNAKTHQVPTVDVKWYAKGGIFAQPTIFATPQGYVGVGEAGREAVLPIDLLEGYIETAMRNTAAGNTINVSMTVDGARDPSAWAAEFASELNQLMRA